MWLFIAILAFFIFAINSLADKLLLKRPIPEPIAYAFFVGLLSIGALILIPFGFTLNTPFYIAAAAIISGILFFLYLVVYFKLLFKGEASRIVPASGALIGIFTFILSRIFLKEQLHPAQILAFLLLILGGILITLKLKSSNKTKNSADNSYITCAGWAKIFFLLCLSSLFFAASFVILKYVFFHTAFVNAFIWSRLGMVLASISLLAIKHFRLLIFSKVKTIAAKTGFLITGNKTLAGLGALLMNFAISKGSVTLISAASGIQYVFIFIFTIIIFFINPNILKEEVAKKVIIQKILAIVFIAVGLTLLVI